MIKLPHVFIVDDEPEILEIVAEMINKKAVVKTFSGPLELLKHFNMADAVIPDLIITDMKMPEMSGINMIRALFSKNIYLPVILLSGNLQIESLTEALNMGIYKVIQKPASIEQIMNYIDQVLIEHDLQIARKEIKKASRQLNEIYASLHLSLVNIIPKEILEKILVQTDPSGKVIPSQTLEELLKTLEQKIENINHIEIALEESKKINRARELAHFEINNK